MINSMEINDIMYREGRRKALDLQERSYGLTNTQLNEESDSLPDFSAAVRIKNMLERPIGFVCKSSAGRVVKLLQAYDSNIYTQEPEDLPAQWGFAWSTNPENARPFISLSTSPYMVNDCCSENGIIYKSLIDNNVWSPSSYPAGWKEISVLSE